LSDLGRCRRPRSSRLGDGTRARHILHGGIARMKSLLHLGSILLLLLTWIIGSHVIGARLLPEPSAVALALVDEARSGALTFNLSATLLRVFAAFAIAMVLGTVIGLLMGRNAIFDWLADPWLIVLLNLPPLFLILLSPI